MLINFVWRHCYRFALFNILLGDFDFLQLQKTNGIFGPIFFILYIFFIFFIVMNLFLAIINENYLIVKDEALREVKEQYTLVDYVKQVRTTAILRHKLFWNTCLIVCFNYYVLGFYI